MNKTVLDIFLEDVMNPGAAQNEFLRAMAKRNEFLNSIDMTTHKVQAVAPDVARNIDTNWLQTATSSVKNILTGENLPGSIILATALAAGSVAGAVILAKRLKAAKANKEQQKAIAKTITVKAAGRTTNPEIKAKLKNALEQY